MFYALTWFAVLSLLALWSLAAWAVHSAGAWAVLHTGALAGGSGSVEVMGIPGWLAPWVPAELIPAFTSLLSAVTPAIGALFEGAPAMAGGLSVLVWVVWGIGTALLIVLGLVLSAVIAMLRRRAPVGTGQPTGATTVS